MRRGPKDPKLAALAESCPRRYKDAPLGTPVLDPKRFTRQELLDLVWSGPLRTVAAKIGISDVGLKKACAKSNIPTPPQGHWNKVVAGKKTVAKPALPPRGIGQADFVWFGGARWDRLRSPSSDDLLPPPPVFEEPIELVRRRIEKMVGRLTVPRNLDTRVHPVIRRILDDEAARREKIQTTTWGAEFFGPRFSSPFDQRRLRLLNALALGVSLADVRVTLWRKEDPILYLDTGAVSMPLFATSVSKRGRGVKTERRDLDVSLVLGVQPEDLSRALRRWDDGPEEKLEARITEIAIETLVALEERWRANQIEHHKWLIERKKQEEEEARKARIELERREREHIQRLERQRIECLLNDANSLRQAEDIRSIVAHVEPTPHVRGNRCRPIGIREMEVLGLVASG